MSEQPESPLPEVSERAGEAEVPPLAALARGVSPAARQHHASAWLVFLGAATMSGALFLAGHGREGIVLLTVPVLWALRDVILRWSTGVCVLLLVLLFVPSRVYKLPTPLPFDLDVYRLVLILLLLAWAVSLAATGHPRPRRTHIGLAAALFLAAIAASYAPSLVRYSSPQYFADMVKNVAYVASFPLTLSLVASVLSAREARRMIDVLVVGGALEGLIAGVERVTSYNPFYHLESFVPALVHVRMPIEMMRGVARVAGSTAHPIALAAVMSMLLMLAVARTVTAGSARARIMFGGCAGLIAMGSMLTLSRTAVVASVAGGLILLAGLPRQRVFLASAAAGLAAAAHLLFNGVLGTLLFMFKPSTLVATEVGNQNGRLEDYAWAVPQILGRPVFGLGFGYLNPDRGARVLDNQFLGLLVEAGVLGAVSFAYMLWRAIAVPFRAAMSASGPDGVLMFGFAAAAVSYAACSAMFDTLGFPQVTYLFFVLAGVCAVIMRDEEARGSVPEGAESPEGADE